MSDSEPIIFRPRPPAGPYAEPASARNAYRGADRGAETRGTETSSANSSAHAATHSGTQTLPQTGTQTGAQIAFNRQELMAILALYGRKVASGEWRDYAIDLTRDKAVFSVFRRTSEVPLYRIEKDPKLARKQGAYSVIATGGRILKRGHDLVRVIGVLDKPLKVVGS